MITLRKSAKAVLVAIAAVGALVVAASGDVLGTDTSVDNGVSVLADSPWGSPTP